MRPAVLRMLCAAAVLLMLNFKGCNWAGDPAGAGVGSALAFHRPNGGTDVTFFVAADTHFGVEGIADLNVRQIDEMNALPGKPLPRQLGGTVQPPRGVLMAGDLTDGGSKAQWREFVAHYGLTGKDGRLRFPLYECTGNHDRHAFLFRPVLDGVKRRHGSLTYSWDWDDVHLVSLDCYPDAANLRWLKRDLAQVGTVRPVALFFHYPLLGPYSDWWKQTEKNAFRDAIRGYNVIAIFHGHYHGSGRYKWEGYDVYNVGSPRHSAHSFAVVRITDTTLTIASRNWDRGTWRWTHRKPINTAAAKAAPHN